MRTARFDAPARTDAAAAAPPKPKPIVHRWLRWPFRIYNTILTFVVLAVLGNIVVIPLGRGTTNWPAAALGQVQALWGYVTTDVPLSAGIGLALVGLYVLSLIARADAIREEHEARDKRVAEIASGTGAVSGAEAGAKAGEQAGEEAAKRIMAAAPAVPPGVAAPSGLPRPATLVGRGGELARLMAALRAGGTVGVFAVKGYPGVGKTALAAEAVARLSEDRVTFPGGAAWVSCEGLSVADGLAELWAQVARQLGAHEVAALPDPEDRRRALHAALADPSRPRLLLALDNVEPGPDADAVLDTLAGGRATLLLTSRGTVAPARLQALELDPLPDPDAGALFAQRLRQVDGSRALDAECEALATLVTMLGGLPLAIELTAAYAGIQRMPLAQVAEEVRAAGTGGPLRRLRDRIDRSWAMLSASQRRLFDSLALLECATFPRSAAVALAQATVEDTTQKAPGTTSDHTAPERATLDLDALVNLALVEPQANRRLRLHPLLREYAAEHLAAMPTETAERLGDVALDYWLGYAQSHPSENGTNVGNMDAQEGEAPSLMGALTWAYTHQRWRQVVDLVYALNWTWFIRGRRDEERRFRPWAVEAARAGGSLQDQRFMVHGLAVLDRQTGELARARAGFEEALRLARELSDRAAIQTELYSLAVLDGRTAELARARTGYEEALRLARELGDKRAIQAELHGLAARDAEAGNVARARAGHEEALQLAREVGERSVVALELRHLGLLEVELGDWSSARPLFDQSLAVARQIQEPANIAESVWWLAELDRVDGNRDVACAGFREALAIYVHLNHPDAQITRDRLRSLGCEP